MTKQEVTMTFNGVNLGKYFRITDVRRPVLSEREITTNDAPSVGVNIQRVKRKAKTIEVEFRMLTEDGQSMELLKHELGGVLNVAEAVRVTFSDETDKYYMAIPPKNIEPDTVASWLQKGTLTLLVPDGVAHSTTYKKITEAENKGDRLVFKIENNGNYPAKPIIRVKHKAENGYLGFVNSTGALEIGNPEEADTEEYKRSELLLDYRDNLILNGFTAAVKNRAILNDTSQTLDGTVINTDNAWGRPHLSLGARGGTSGQHAGTLTWDIPRGSDGVAGSLHDYIWWRQIFWLGATSEFGFLKVMVSDTEGRFLYGVETYKRANGLWCEFNILGANGRGGYDILRRFNFLGTHNMDQNPFNEPRGWSDMRRVDDTITFYWFGSYIPITIPQIKGRKSAKIHVAFGSIGDRPIVRHMYLDGLMYRKDNVSAIRDVPNSFQPNSTVEINTETDSALVNGLSASQRIIHGSQWLTLPPKSSTLEVFTSSWCKTKPEVTISFEELF